MSQGVLRSPGTVHRSVNVGLWVSLHSGLHIHPEMSHLCNLHYGVVALYDNLLV